jgi:hypothetical protein
VLKTEGELDAVRICEILLPNTYKQNYTTNQVSSYIVERHKITVRGIDEPSDESIAQFGIN